MMKVHNIFDLKDAVAANQAVASEVVLRRGPQLMVVMTGCPHTRRVEALCRAGVRVGLALSAGGLAKASNLDHYSFVFVGAGQKAASPLKQALSDLAYNGWLIDEAFYHERPMTEHRQQDTDTSSMELAIA